MNSSNEKDLLVTQLLRETLTNNLNWQVLEPPFALNRATERVVPLYLQCHFKGATIGVYEVRGKNYIDVDEYYWAENLGICITMESGIVVWQDEEYSPALRDLYQMARQQASGLRRMLGM